MVDSSGARTADPYSKLLEESAREYEADLCFQFEGISRHYFKLTEEQRRDQYSLLHLHAQSCEKCGSLRNLMINHPQCWQTRYGDPKKTYRYLNATSRQKEKDYPDIHSHLQVCPDCVELLKIFAQFMTPMR